MPELQILLRELPEDEGFFSGVPLANETLEDTPLPAPAKRLKKEVVVSKISKFLEKGEQPLAKIAENIGHSERTVRRDLKESVKWTEADNRELINEALRVYIEMVDLCKEGSRRVLRLKRSRILNRSRSSRRSTPASRRSTGS